MGIVPPSDKPKTDPLGRLVLPDCPGCDASLTIDGLGLNEQTRCPHCNSLLLLVKIDGVVMFFREGWT